MDKAIHVLLIDQPSFSLESIADAFPNAQLAEFRLQAVSLEASLPILDAGAAGIVLCAFNGNEASFALLKRVLELARSVPVVTYGPDESALPAIAAGSEEHISPQRLDTTPLAAILRIALERRRRWQTVEANEARLRTLIQANADSLVLVDESGTVRFANRAAEKLFNRGSDELVGSVMGTPSGEAGVVELSIVRPDTNETIAAEMRVVEIELGGRIGYIESIRDVTEQKQKAQQAHEAIQMRDHFLAMLSHELRNPLAALTGASQVLSLEQSQCPALGLPIEIIQRQCHHMVRLLDDLLDISRISQGKVELRKEYVSFSQMVSDCLQVMRPRIEHTHCLKVDLPQETLYVHVDPSRMQQVLANLLTNSVKYSPAGGEICIRAKRSGGEAVMEIQDQGHGIQAEMLESIFEPFVQAEQTLARSDGGFGIGLAVVRRLVELHGGRIEAASEGLGHGSQFTMHLPLARPVFGQPTTDTRACSKRLRICIVEDVSDIASMLRKLLEKLGHQVMIAPDGEAGLKMILASPPDVAFLDIGLPGLTGYEVAERIANDPRGRGIILVAMTGYGQSEDHQRALDGGFDYHLVKPVSFQSLQHCLAEVVDNGK